MYGLLAESKAYNEFSSKEDLTRSKRASSHLSSNQMMQFYQKLVAYPDMTEKFNKTNISWGVVDRSLHQPEHEIDAIIKAAFKIWAEVTPLTFHRDTKNPDIIIRFGTGKCAKKKGRKLVR